MEGAAPPIGAPQAEMRMEEERDQGAHHSPPPLSPQRQAAGGGGATFIVRSEGVVSRGCRQQQTCPTQTGARGEARGSALEENRDRERHGGGMLSWGSRVSFEGCGCSLPRALAGFPSRPLAKVQRGIQAVEDKGVGWLGTEQQL